MRFHFGKDSIGMHSACLILMVLIFGTTTANGTERKIPPIKEKPQEKVEENIPVPSKTGKPIQKRLKSQGNLQRQFSNSPHIYNTLDTKVHDDLTIRQKVPVASEEEEAVIDKVTVTHEKRTLDDESSENENFQRTVKRPSYDYGIDTGLLTEKQRKGMATHTESCKSVRGVPSALRKPTGINPPIPMKYTKYTEAYGIPVIGSKQVTDVGLKRACYVVKVMFSSHYGIRNSYYKWNGRVALIADDEQVTDLPEYNDKTQFDPAYWNGRARGLGATEGTPTCSAGDDNMRCKAGERYFDQCILVHELAHGFHLLGARYAVPGFERELLNMYKENVQKRHMWKGTYAAENEREYFAVASQFYFDCYQGDSYKKFGVVDRQTFERYDKKMTALLDKVYPCNANRNKMIHRCAWKGCSDKDFELVTSGKVNTNCQVVKASYSRDTIQRCAQFTCYYLGNAFYQKGPTCLALKCKSSKSKLVPPTKPNHKTYRIKKEKVMTVKQELEQNLDYCCTVSPKSKSRCTKIPGTLCSPGAGKTRCLSMGCCYKNNKCYLPEQRCANKHAMCLDWEKAGDCSNCAFMYRNCALACNVCDKVESYDSARFRDLENACQDRNGHCSVWVSSGNCKISKYQAFMRKECTLGCKMCTKKPHC